VPAQQSNHAQIIKLRQEESAVPQQQRSYASMIVLLMHAPADSGVDGMAITRYVSACAHCEHFTEVAILVNNLRLVCLCCGCCQACKRRSIGLITSVQALKVTLKGSVSSGPALLPRVHA
jgi:hypothetical protein